MDTLAHIIGKAKQKSQFFSSVPFGMTAQEMNSWLYYGDGIKLWEEVYANFNLIQGQPATQVSKWEVGSIKR